MFFFSNDVKIFKGEGRGMGTGGDGSGDGKGGQLGVVARLAK